MIPAIIFYILGANLCYTAGWISELLARLAWGSDSKAYSEITFLAGLAFSIALTLLPFFLSLAIAISAEIFGMA